MPRAVVSGRGWHTERLYASTLEASPELLRFVELASVKYAARILGTESMAKILCLPALPASEEHRESALQFLKDKGIDGILTFRTMLSELIVRVETHRNYEKSDLLQIIRLLKNYDFLKDSQLELFGKRKRGARKR